ncbi:ATP-binding protein [Acinetobacter higginsii]|uniref:ATP-binding protein n=1 Tax=Acinetobacter higginsii TaxID=70347 RepID=UPI001F4A68E0|nr:ATP-binding protein [Acinetobacter higginsii]MCH7295824.1 ATP-binding protein [Acinetobacter higginsii]MDO3664709.1 ATP-binding protein [Acinetobacter higginsii]
MNFFLSGYDFEENFYNFFPPDEMVCKSKNIFTIIIGNNGIGKSRFLGKIEHDLLNATEDIENIISVSLSNSHKFNAATNTNQNLFIPMHHPEYHYGMATLETSSNRWISSIESYIKYKNDNRYTFFLHNYYSTKVDILDYKKIFKLCLINTINDNLIGTRPIINNNIKKILNFLNFEDKLNIKFNLSKSYHDYKNQALLNKEIFNFIKETCNLLKIKNLEEIEDKKYSLFEDIYMSDNFIILLMQDVIEIKSINLKIKNNKEIYYTDLSSGQKTILSLGLSLICSLKDNSIILIDEPELSLHPEWQEKIMPLIQDISSDYIGCQFIIATHSPQIVSSIQYKYSYLLDLNTNKIKNISKFKNRSSDFQLSEVFKTPGNNNEYLIRKLVIMLSKLNSNQDLNIEEEHIIKIVKKLYSEKKFHDKDKVKTLIELIIELGG